MNQVKEQEVLDAISKELSEELKKQMTAEQIKLLLSFIFLLAQTPVEEIVRGGFQETAENLLEIRSLSLRTLQHLESEGLNWQRLVVQIRAKHGLVENSDPFANIMNSSVGGTIQ